MDHEILLSILISTYNRAELVCENLKHFLECKRSDVEFIVCDNCSRDDTIERLKAIKDRRLKVLRREVNLGAQNTIILSAAASGKYIVVVNDRDYIKSADLERLCGKLKQIKECDCMVLLSSRKKREGYYGGSEFCRFFWDCNHPGNIIYNRKFYNSYIDFDYVETNARKGRIKENSRYCILAVLYHVQICYYFPADLIIQPKNRDMIKQTRKEVYGSAYILPEFNKREYDNLSNGCIRHEDKSRSREILKNLYIKSLYKVTVEYRRSLKLKGFAARNHCENRRSSEWFKNAVCYTAYVIWHPNTKKMHMRRVILTEFFKFGFSDSIRGILHIVRKFLKIRNYRKTADE